VGQKCAGIVKKIQGGLSIKITISLKDYTGQYDLYELQ
jgi:hypothetical protein